MIVLVSKVKLCYNEDRFKFCDNFDDFAEQILKFQTQKSKNKYHFRVKEHISHTTNVCLSLSENTS